MSHPDTETFDDLVAVLLEGTASDSQRAAFSRLLETHPERVADYMRQARMHVLLASCAGVGATASEPVRSGKGSGFQKATGLLWNSAQALRWWKRAAAVAAVFAGTVLWRWGMGSLPEGRVTGETRKADASYMIEEPVFSAPFERQGTELPSAQIRHREGSLVLVETEKKTREMPETMKKDDGRKKASVKSASAGQAKAPFFASVNSAVKGSIEKEKTGMTASEQTKTGRATVLSAILAVASGSSMAADQYWNPTTTAKGAGSGTWDVAVGAWAASSAGTTAPVPWVNGNNAHFTLNSGVNTATVNGVSANLLNFTAGTYVLQPGSGALTSAGALTNTGNTVTLNCDVALAADQTWYLTKATTVNGAMTGDFTLTKTGSGTLTVSNAVNRFAGLTVNSGLVQAYAGGDVLGGTSGTLTLGQTDQIALAQLTLNTTAAGDTVYDIGNIAVAGASQLSLNTAANSTNALHAGALGRARGATLLVAPQNGLGARERITFAGGAITPVNGMIAPWMVDTRTGSFVTYDGELADAVFDTGTWDGTKKINASSAVTLNANASVYALKVSSGNVTVSSGAVLEAGGGFILTGGSVLGGGTVSVDTNELVAYVTGSRSLSPVIDGSGGLTLFGGGTLSLSGLTYTGDTWINQGSLAVSPSDDQVYGGAINGLGTLTLNGSGSLTLTATNATLGSLGFGGASPTLVLNGTLNTLNMANLTAATGSTGTLTSSGQGGVWNLNGANINNTAGAVCNSNRVFFDDVTVTNAGSVYIGFNATVIHSYNGLTVNNGTRFFSGGVYVGEPGSVESFYAIGGGTKRVTVWNGAITVGSGYTYYSPDRYCWNARLSVTNADLTLGGNLAVGGRDSSNCTATVFSDAVVNMGSKSIALGSPDSSAHYTTFGHNLTINGGLVTNVGTITVGNGYNDTAVNAVSNSLCVFNGGQLYSGNVKVGNRANDYGNAYYVGGFGARSLVSNGTISVSINGEMAVTNATLYSGALTVGGGSSQNAVKVCDEALWNLGNANVTVGSGTGAENSLTVDGGCVTNVAALAIGGAATSLSNRLVLAGGALYAASLTVRSSNFIEPVIGPGGLKSIAVSGTATLYGSSYLRPRMAAGAVPGTYTVLTAGTLIDNGVALDPETDARRWSFKVEANTLKVTYKAVGTVVLLF